MKKVFILLFFLHILTLRAQQDALPFQQHTLLLEKRIEDLISRLTLNEKIGLLQHNSPGIERLEIAPYSWWNEALHGVARAGIATVFPQPIALAATFDDEFIVKVFSVVSDEARAKYNEAQKKGLYGDYHGLTFWTPNINIFRDPRWGRGMETYGEDPFLTAKLGIATVKGLQGDDPFYLKSAACAKHFAVHSGPEGIRHEFNATASRKDMELTYFPVFEMLIKEGKVAQVMCAYNRFNGVPCCTDPFLLKKILRERWQYHGVVVTDCWAINDFWEPDTIIPRHKTHFDAKSAVASAFNNEVDLECGNSYEALIEAIKEGMLTEDMVDQHLKRVLEIRFRLGMFDKNKETPWDHFGSDIIGSPEHHTIALEAARKSIVLLKNENRLLPLSKENKKIAVIGPNAHDSIMLWGNYNGIPKKTTTILDGIRKKIPQSEMIYNIGGDLVHYSGNREDSTQQLNLKTLSDIAGQSDIIIFAGGLSPELEGEELPVKTDGFERGDRTKITLPKVQQEMLKTLRQSGKPIILLLCAGSAIDLQWEEEMMDAILYVWYGGEAAGDAVADVLFGDYNPAGRLPVTFYRSTQLRDFKNYSMTNRTYQHITEEPLYPFGYGLSYSHFDYQNPKYILNSTSDSSDSVWVTFSVEVKNNGPFDGEDVIQVYVKNPHYQESGPFYTLAAFKRTAIKNGEKRTISLQIPLKSFFTFDPQKKVPVYIPGTFSILFGGSADPKKLQSIELELH